MIISARYSTFARLICIPLLGIWIAWPLGAIALQEPETETVLSQNSEAAAPQAPETEPAAQEDAAGDPHWLSKRLARTVDPLPLLKVESDDGFFSARVPARLLKPVEMVEGIYLMSLDFGAGPENLAECYIYRDDMDLASSVQRLSEALFQVIGESYGELEMRAIYGIDAGGIGPVPYLGIDWLYRTAGKGERGPVAGQAKHLMASKAGRSIYCQSVAIGFDDAFFGLFSRLVTSLRYASPGLAEPHYHALFLVSVADQVLGIARESHRMDADGDVEIRHNLSLLVPAEDQGIQSRDTLLLEFAKTDGRLLGQVRMVVENNLLVRRLNLRSQDNGGWHAEGISLGRDVAAELGEVDFLSSLGERLRLRELLKAPSAGDSYLFDSWTVEEDPNGSATTRVTFLGEETRGSKVLLEHDTLRLTAVIDRRSFSRALLDKTMGEASLRRELIFDQGDPFFPLTLSPPETSSDVEPSDP